MDYASVESEPLSFGTIATKVLYTQEAFNNVNEVSFPDLEEFPSVPESIFKADRMGTEAAKQRPLRSYPSVCKRQQGLAQYCF